MDVGRTSFVTDGPEYSRLSESLKQTHWYAEGHTDPNEDEDDRERARSYRQEEEKMKEKKRLMEEAASRKGGVSSDEEGAKQPRDPHDLSPKSSNPKRGERSLGRTGDEAPGGTAPSGSSADDEGSSPPSNSPKGSTGSPRGAQYIPATTSIQDAPGDLEQAESRRSASVSSGWSQSLCSRCMSKTRFVVHPVAFVVTSLLFIFAFFLYMTLLMWLDPNLNKVLSEKVPLRPSHLNPSPAHRSSNLRLEVFFYNVTLVEDAQGIPQINIEDMGPYTYLVKSFKTDVKWNSNRTVTYRVKDTFHFQANRSVGGQNDVVNTMDANVLTKLSKMKVENHTKPFHVNITDGMMKPQTVADFLWGSDDTAEGRGRDSSWQGNLTLSKDSRKSNESTSPVYNVYTGKGDWDRLNEVYTFNNSRANRMWPYGHDHYPMSGSADGDFFPPMIKSGKTLSFFYSQTERNLLLYREKSVTVHGHEAYRFTLGKYSNNHVQPANDSSSSSSSESSSHGNSSVPTPSPVDDDQVITLTEEDLQDAPPREAFALQYLRSDSPFLVSFLPKSYHGPDGNGSQMCKMHLDVHPVSGITLRKRLCHQMSLPVVYPGPKGNGHILPIMWVDWFFESAPDDLNELVTSYHLLFTAKEATLAALVVMCAVVGFIGLQMCCLLGHYCYRRKRGRDGYANIRES